MQGMIRALNSTQPNSTQLNSTQLNSTQLNSTQLNSTQLNSTQLNPTQLNSTQLNPTQAELQTFLVSPQIVEVMSRKFVNDNPHRVLSSTGRPGPKMSAIRTIQHHQTFTS